jgi:tetratricopeptide (TPR) repeat protein
MSTSTEFAAFVGIDWADQEHAVCLVESDGSPWERSVVEQKAESLDAWVQGLRIRFEGRRVAVCLEQSRGALLYALMKYECLVLFPLNPKQAARYREAFTPSGAKDDPTDAELLCGFVRQHHTRLRAWRPDDVTTRGLRLLTEQRRKWVEQRTALGNQLIRHLKECYPLARTLGSKHVYTEGFLALLVRFPSQRELQRASPKQLARYLSKRRRLVDDSAPESADQRIATIRAASPLVTDAAVLQAGRLAVLSAMRGDSTVARRHATASLSRDPRYRHALWALARADDLDGNIASAEQGYRQVLERYPTEERTLASLGHLLARAGRRDEALEIARKLHAMVEQNRRRETFEALVRTGLGEKQEALTLIEQAWRMRDANVLNLELEVRFLPLAREPRFQAVAQQLRGMR